MFQFVLVLAPSLIILLISLPSILATCVQVLIAKSASQTLSSPDSLDSTSRCKWTVDSRSDLEPVKITVKDLKMGTDCAKEYLEIADDPMVSGTVAFIIIIILTRNRIGFYVKIVGKHFI